MSIIFLCQAEFKANDYRLDKNSIIYLSNLLCWAEFLAGITEKKRIIHV